MKNHSIHLLSVAGLLLAGSLSAHTMASTATTPTPMTHGHPVFEDASTTYTLYNDKAQDRIVVTWTPTHACSDASLTQEYTVTIKRSQAAAVVYSLWTFGIQGANAATVVSSITTPATGKVLMAKSVYAALFTPQKDQLVDPAGLMADPADPSRMIVKDDQIWMAEFTGNEFTFVVKRYNRPGETHWNLACPPASGHDNTPPN